MKILNRIKMYFHCLTNLHREEHHFDDDGIKKLFCTDCNKIFYLRK